MLDFIPGARRPRSWRAAGASLLLSSTVIAAASAGCSARSESVDGVASFEQVGHVAEAMTNESLSDYAAECDAYTGVTVPDFDCDEGTEVPMTNAQGSGASLTCDRPNRLNSECDPGSKFHVLTNNDDAYVVAHCRKRAVVYGNVVGDGVFADIAVIQHNKKNGATCFYQALQDHLSGKVAAPSKGSYPWLSPAATANINCVSCHDNGPIIRSPYLAQITGPNKLPGSGDASFNRSEPYTFVGGDFASWRVFKVEVQGNTCNGCHRMGTSMTGGTVNGSHGTSKDFALRATSDAPESHQNAHSPSSPLWMTPGNNGVYSQSNRDAAQAIANCARMLVAGQPLPSSSACKITDFTAPFEARNFTIVPSLSALTIVPGAEDGRSGAGVEFVTATASGAPTLVTVSFPDLPDGITLFSSQTRWQFGRCGGRECSISVMSGETIRLTYESLGPVTPRPSATMSMTVNATNGTFTHSFPMSLTTNPCAPSNACAGVQCGTGSDGCGGRSNCGGCADRFRVCLDNRCVGTLNCPAGWIQCDDASCAPAADQCTLSLP